MRSNLTIDHVRPTSKGGDWSWENLVTACVKCNGKKGDSTLKQLGWKLKKQPQAGRRRLTCKLNYALDPRRLPSQLHAVFRSSMRNDVTGLFAISPVDCASGTWHSERGQSVA